MLRDGDSWGCGGDDINDDAILCDGEDVGAVDCSSSNGCNEDGGFEATLPGKRLYSSHWSSLDDLRERLTDLDLPLDIDRRGDLLLPSILSQGDRTGTREKERRERGQRQTAAIGEARWSSRGQGRGWLRTS